MNKDLIIKELDRLFIEPKCELDYEKDYELLLSVMLSAQTTDKRVNIVTKPLYKKYNSLEKLNTLTLEELNEYLKSIGFHKTKSIYFKQIVEEILKIGYVPNDRKILEKLPVKYKTVIVLHYLEGFSVEEIARMLRISASAVKMRLSRGREQMKEVIEREENHVS